MTLSKTLKQHAIFEVNTLLVLSLLVLLIFPQTYAENVRSQLIAASNGSESGEYVRKRFLQQMKMPFDSSDSQKKALIIGDSYAQDFYNSVLESDLLNEYQVRTRYIPTICQICTDKTLKKYIDAKNIPLCEKSDNMDLAQTQIQQSDVIILAANWKEWSAKHLPQTIETLNLRDDQKLIVIGRKSFGKVAIRRYLRMSDKKLLTLRNKPDALQTKINTMMKDVIDEDTFVDLQDIICDSQATCPVFSKDLSLISFDGGHLTPAGAKHMGEKLLEHSILGEL